MGEMAERVVFSPTQLDAARRVLADHFQPEGLDVLLEAIAYITVSHNMTFGRTIADLVYMVEAADRGYPDLRARLAEVEE